MNQENINKIISELKQIKLTETERTRLFADLNTYIDSHIPELKTPKVVRSPYSVFYRHVFNVSMSVIVAVLAFGSTVFASKGALPGDILYPVKRKVSEPLEVAFAKNSEDEGQIYVAHIIERLKEAEELAVQGRLASSTADDLGDSIEMQADLVMGINTGKNRNDLDVSVSAHTEILKKIEDRSDVNQREHIKNIVKRVEKSHLRKAETKKQKKVKEIRKSEVKNSDEDRDKIFSSKKETILLEIESTIVNIKENNNDEDSLKRDILDSASDSVGEVRKELNDAEEYLFNDNEHESEELIENSEKKLKQASISAKRAIELGKLKGNKR